MDKDYIEEQDIAGKYLRGELTAEEIESFELVFMEDPGLLQRLELDAAFYRHARAAHEELKNVNKNNRLSSFIQVAMGMVAGVLIMTFTPQLTRDDDDLLDRLGIAQVEYIDQFRGVAPGKVPTRSIELNSSAENLVIVIDTGDIVNMSYDIVVNRNSGNRQVVSSAINVADTSGELVIYIPVKLISEDVYVLTMYESGTRDVMKTFFLDVSH